MSGRVEFQLANDGDLARANGAWVRGDYPAQRVQCRLRAVLKEWFLDRSDGTAYLQMILVKNPNIGHARAELRDRVLGTEGIQALTSLDLTVDLVRRKCAVSLLAVDDSGNPVRLRLQFP